jgi:hypothetical protein
MFPTWCDCVSNHKQRLSLVQHNTADTDWKKNTWDIQDTTARTTNGLHSWLAVVMNVDSTLCWNLKSRKATGSALSLNSLTRVNVRISVNFPPPSTVSRNVACNEGLRRNQEKQGYGESLWIRKSVCPYTVMHKLCVMLSLAQIQRRK